MLAGDRPEQVEQLRQAKSQPAIEHHMRTERRRPLGHEIAHRCREAAPEAPRQEGAEREVDGTDGPRQTQDRHVQLRLAAVVAASAARASSTRRCNRATSARNTTRPKSVSWKVLRGRPGEAAGGESTSSSSRSLCIRAIAE